MEVRFERHARRDLERLDVKLATAALAAIEAFATTGTGDVKKLRDYDPPTWRLRVGRYRVLFRRVGPALIVDAIEYRRDAYR